MTFDRHSLESWKSYILNLKEYFTTLNTHAVEFGKVLEIKSISMEM